MRRSLVVWLVMLVAASMNGALREAWLIPAFGDRTGRALSTVMLSALVAWLTWSTIRWIAPQSKSEAWAIGGGWVALTLVFEFIAGHYLFGKPWSALTEDYDVLGGRIWILVLVTIVVAPRVCAGLRGKSSR